MCISADDDFICISQRQYHKDGAHYQSRRKLHSRLPLGCNNPMGVGGAPAPGLNYLIFQGCVLARTLDG